MVRRNRELGCLEMIGDDKNGEGSNDRRSSVIDILARECGSADGRPRIFKD